MLNTHNQNNAEKLNEKTKDEREACIFTQESNQEGYAVEKESISVHN